MNVIIIQTISDYRGAAPRSIGGHQLAWYLRLFGYTVQVINYSEPIFTLDKVNALFEKFVTDETKVIGLGGILLEANDVFFSIFSSAIKQLKTKHPNLKIIAGGPSVGIIKGKLKKTLDYYFTGHAENTMLQFCNWIFKKGPQPFVEIGADGYKIVKESSYQSNEGFSIEQCNFRWHDSDAIQPNEALPLETTRGCIFKCKFCQYPLIGKNKKDFLKPMENIRDDLLDNYERFGTTNYYILDDTFNADTERLEEFAKMVSSLPFKIKYATYLRLDLIEAHRHTEDMLLESGLYGAFFGIESFNKDASALVGKAFSGKKAKDYLPHLLQDRWQGKVKEHLSFIAGIPPETLDDLKETHNWCVDNKITSWKIIPLLLNKPDTSVFTSEFERNAEKYGFEIIQVLPESYAIGKRLWRQTWWKHSSGLTFLDVVKWTNLLTESAAPHVKRGGWNAVEVLQFGYTVEEIDRLRWGEYNLDNEWQNRVHLFVQTYYNDLMSLK
jgi:radical SAM superfamily enzyme YgiQ (UPF0313 family)